jgi:hypothetical protein
MRNTSPSGLLRATAVARGRGLMLAELSVVKQRYHAVMEVVSTCGPGPRGGFGVLFGNLFTIQQLGTVLVSVTGCTRYFKM